MRARQENNGETEGKEKTAHCVAVIPSGGESLNDLVRGVKAKRGPVQAGRWSRKKSKVTDFGMWIRLISKEDLLRKCFERKGGGTPCRNKRNFDSG